MNSNASTFMDDHFERMMNPRQGNNPPREGSYHRSRRRSHDYSQEPYRGRGRRRGFEEYSNEPRRRNRGFDNYGEQDYRRNKGFDDYNEQTRRRNRGFDGYNEQSRRRNRRFYDLEERPRRRNRRFHDYKEVDRRRNRRHSNDFSQRRRSGNAYDNREQNVANSRREIEWITPPERSPSVSPSEAARATILMSGGVLPDSPCLRDNISLDNEASFDILAPEFNNEHDPAIDINNEPLFDSLDQSNQEINIFNQTVDPFSSPQESTGFEVSNDPEPFSYNPWEEDPHIEKSTEQRSLAPGYSRLLASCFASEHPKYAQGPFGCAPPTQNNNPWSGSSAMNGSNVNPFRQGDLYATNESFSPNHSINPFELPSHYNSIDKDVEFFDSTEMDVDVIDSVDMEVEGPEYHEETAWIRHYEEEVRRLRGW